jgi:DNA-binding transcriptional regulator YiaG
MTRTRCGGSQAWRGHVRTETVVMRRDETQAGTPVLDMSPAEHRDFVGQELRRRLGMSAEEFCRRYIAGELDDSDPDVGMLAALIATGQIGPKVTTMKSTASEPTMALADLLIALRQRVPLSEAQISRGTGADEETVRAWLGRRRAPAGEQGQRLAEVVAFVEEMARNLHGETLARWWLDGQVDVLDGANPFDEIAGGRYERMIQYARGISGGVFT